MASLESQGWAHLPPEIVDLILARFAEITDRVRFACVCAPWRRSASKSIPSPSNSPWLLLPKSSTDAEAGRCRFFSLSERRTYSLTRPATPKMGTQKLCPSQHSGLIVAPMSTRTLAFVNPLTGSSFTLPPLTQSEHLHICSALLLRRAKIFRSDGVEIVAVVFDDRRDIQFWRAGEASWHRIDTGLNFSCGDFVYFCGRLLVTSENRGVIRVFDAETLGMVGDTYVPGHWSSCCWFVEWPPGELLLVQRNAMKRFVLHRLGKGWELGAWNWMEVKDIGDNVGLVDGIQAMVLPAAASGGGGGNDDDDCGLKRNCVCFTEYRMGEGRERLRLFDIGKGKLDGARLLSYESERDSGAMWFVPSL